MTSMMLSTPEERHELARLNRSALQEYQLLRLNRLLSEILPSNQLYRQKLAADPAFQSTDQVKLDSLDELRRLPFTCKDELQPPQEAGHAPGPNLTYPWERYVRFHQTSGTRGRPLMVLDTAEDWAGWIDCWQWVLDSAGVTANDRVMMAFSFGPFIGFWSAHDAAVARGCLVLPGGGMSSLSRLQMIRHLQATVILCTPSYALHLAEVAASHELPIHSWDVRCLILAGEPGGSIPAIRQKIESAWEAQAIDHSGASEVGAWGFSDRDRLGLHLNEGWFIPEFFNPQDQSPAREGELAELVITSLGRAGFPVIRYRTGDLVKPIFAHDQPCRFTLLEGGILGRTDDMMIIRGVNIFPTAIEAILRSFPEIREYRMIATRVAEMDQLTIEIEDSRGEPNRVAEELRTRLGLRVDVHCVPADSLPRFEAKGRRFIDQRRS